MLRTNARGANTQTIVLEQPLSGLSSNHRPITLFRLRKSSSPDGDDSGSSSSSDSVDSADGMLDCDKVAHVYATFVIVKASKDRSKPIANVDIGHNAYTKIKALLDPAEFELYSSLWFQKSKRILILPYIKSYNLKAGVELLLVRCVNNSLHYIPAPLLQNGIAKTRHDFETADEPKKHALGEKTYFAFEREKREVEKLTQRLRLCMGNKKQNSQSCDVALDKLCNETSKYPDALRAIQKLGNSRHKTWEEVCFDTSKSISINNSKTEDNKQK